VVALDVADTQCNLHERIQYSRLQVEAAKLRAKGCSEAAIADALEVDYRSVHRALKAFEKVASTIRNDIRELSKVGYWEKARIKRLKNDIGADQLERALQRQEELRNEGYWPWDPPIGYVRTGRGWELDIDPEKAESVSDMFKGRTQGKTTVQLARETGIGAEEIGFILRNPFYYGVIRWKGRIIPGKHPAIISKETWELAQPRKDYPLSTHRKAPYGYHWRTGQLEKDPEAEKVYQVFSMRAKRESLWRISKSVGLSIGSVRHIILNPIYKGVTPDGKPMPHDFEAAVDSNLWWSANRVHNQTVKELIEERRRRKGEHENLILTCLIRNPLSRKDLATETRLSRYRVGYLTYDLKRRGLIQKSGGKRGKWHLMEDRKETAQDQRLARVGLKA
jgi:DNA-binding MarR family transcriptional regulator